MSKHTQGQWTIEPPMPAHDTVLISSPDGWVAMVADGNKTDEGKYRARLIASSPELYEMLLQAVLRVEVEKRDWEAGISDNAMLSAWLPGARALIARIEGRE